jgi:hypothetical protein
MRIALALLIATYSSISIAQTDSMIVEKTDGTIHGYPVSMIYQINFSGTATSVKDQKLIQNILSSFTLYQNYPNPFNPSTTIQYNMPKSGNVEIRIFDIQGRLIRTFIKNYQQAGTHSLVWDSRINTGTVVAGGTYFCQVLFNGDAFVKKLVFIK